MDKRMYSLDPLQNFPNDSVDQSLFQKLIEDNKLKIINSVEDVKFSSVVLIKMTGTSAADMDTHAKTVYDLHQETSVGISFTGNPHTMELMVAIMRKRTSKPFVLPSCLNILAMWSLNLKKKRGCSSDMVIEAIFASLRYGGINWRNFDFETIAEFTLETLDAEVRNKRPREIDDEIIKSTAIEKKKRTARDNMIVAVGVKLAQRRRDEDKGMVALKFLTTASHFALNSFIGVDQLQCQTFDVITGDIIEYSLNDYFMQGYWVDTTLVLLGNSSRGKTELLLSMCQRIASKTQKDEYEAYYILAGTVDSLRSAVDDGLIKSNVPVLFDDLTPGLKRGSRPCMSLDDIKKFCEVVLATAINARNKDIEMAANMPRLVNSNATSPHGWHHDLPVNVWTMTSAERKALDASIHATFKRCTFRVVTDPLYDSSQREAARVRRRAEAAKPMAEPF